MLKSPTIVVDLSVSPFSSSSGILENLKLFGTYAFKIVMSYQWIDPFPHEMFSLYAW